MWHRFRCIVPFTELKKERKKSTSMCSLCEETTRTTNVRTWGSKKYLDINAVKKMWENLK